MTIVIPPQQPRPAPAPEPAPTAPQSVQLQVDQRTGCVEPGCRVGYTTQLHPYRGRLCPRHAVLPTLPPGPYRPDLADDIVWLGRADRAFSYLAAFLAAEAERRSGQAAGRLP